jgi:hypothetical protein
MIRMTHPEHGVTHVYTDSELNERLAKGWSADPEGSVQDETGAEVVIAPKPIRPPQETQEPEPPKRKPGRPRKVQ